MSTIDQLAAEITSLVDRYYCWDHDGTTSEDSVLLGYNPRPIDSGDTKHDWWARVKNTEGFGDDAEMALLDLKSKIERMIQDFIDKQNARITQEIQRLEMLKTSFQK